MLLEAGAPPVSTNVVWLRQRIRALWELPNSRADINLLLFSLLCSHHRVPHNRRHLDRVVLRLERISLEGPRREGIVDGLVATSSVGS